MNINKLVSILLVPKKNHDSVGSKCWAREGPGCWTAYTWIFLLCPPSPANCSP